MAQVERTKGGAIVIILPISEALLLHSLPSRLRGLLEKPDFHQRAVARLFPPAYSDPQQEAEYRRLVVEDLRRRRLESVEIFERTMAVATLSRGKAHVEIRPEEFEAWLGCINDLRLAIAAELDIREEDWSKAHEPGDPNAEEMALLRYLSWLEELLLAAKDPGFRPPETEEEPPER